MFSLLFSDRFKRRVLEPLHCRLEDLEVYDGGAVVVVVSRLPVIGAVDVEVGGCAAVHSFDFDVRQLAAARQCEGAEEKVIGSDHARLPR
jgi:hypothetical protein